MAKDIRDEELIEVEEFDGAPSSSTTPDFINQNRNLIFIGVGALIVIAALAYVYFVFYMGPKEERAKKEMFRAEYYFAQDSFQLALTGRTGEFKGLLDIIDEYGGTEGANLASYYAGTSYLYIGEYDFAIKFLGDYSSSDEVTQAMAYGMIGDAYVEKGENEQAIQQYEKAAKLEDNDVISPYYLHKAGMVSELLNKPEEAKAYYERITENYAESAIVEAAEKDLVRLNR